MKRFVKSVNIKQNGFTLIELLTATAIIVIVTGVITGVIYSTLRGSNQIRATKDVAQNGNLALSIISHTIINSIDIVEMVDRNGNILTNPDCTTTDVNYTGVTHIRSLTFLQSDKTTTIKYTCDNTNFKITSQASGNPTPMPVFIYDSDRVKITECNFSCWQDGNNSYAYPIIGIKFTVSQISDTTTFENRARSMFSTSVTMRNFQRAN